MDAKIKEAFKRIKPESCVFVISTDGRKPSGMIASWHMKCSNNPPLYAVCLSKGGYTGKLIRKSEDFVIALPNKGLVKEVEYFGTTHGDEVNKFHDTGIEKGKAKVVDSPILTEATINLECRLDKEVDSGDHVIYIGRVVYAHIDREKHILFNMGKIVGRRVFREITLKRQ